MTYHDLKRNEWRYNDMIAIAGGDKVKQLRSRSSPHHAPLSQRVFCDLTRFPEGTLKLLEKPSTASCKVSTAIALAEALAAASGSGDPSLEFDLFVAPDDHISRNLKLRCRFLTPFQLCARTNRLLGCRGEDFSFKQINGNYVQCEPDLALYWFPHGVGVWVLEHEATFDSVSRYAEFRRSLYYSVINLHSHRINAVTRRVRSEASGNDFETDDAVSYVLGIAEVLEAPWPSAELHNGLKLVSWPSLLIPTSREGADIQACRAIERSLLTGGVRHREFCSFGIDHIMSGYACWAGVSMLVHDRQRAVSFEEITRFEVALQSAWALVDKCGGGFQSHDSNSSTLAVDIGIAKNLVSRLGVVGARESTLHRLAAEAILTTSRIELNLSKIAALPQSN
jgi:hypothetical protein